MTASPLLDQARCFALYNRWANRRLYDAVAGLDAAEIARPRAAAFFGSLLGTLNHILVGDRLWLARLTGRDSGIRRLDEILHDELPALRGAREAEDERIIAFVDDLGADDLERPLAYRTVAGEARVTPIGLVLAHLFNHQTHHRGQAHALLSETPVAPPPLDLIYYLRTVAEG